MGNQQTKLNNDSIYPSTHPLFQKARFAEINKTPLIQGIQPTTPKDYENWKNIIMDPKKPLNHQFLLLPEYTGYKEDGGLCASTGNATNLYPLYPNNLQTEIERRRPTKEYFKQSELYYLLYALTTAKIDMRDHGFRLGDVRPSNVFINKDRKAKVVNLLTSPLETTNYARALKSSGDGLLAPEDLPLLAKGAKDNAQNSKSEVYSIGATIISAATLNNFNGVYKKNAFDQNGLKELTDQFSAHQKYSQIFKGIVLNLVHQDPSKRINIPSLYKFLYQYKQPINARIPFVIEKAPVHFQENVSFIRSKSQVRESGIKMLT